MKSSRTVLCAVAVLLVAAAPATAVTLVSSCGSLGPGSYQLTGDVTASGNCFVLSADGVTLNFAGYTVKGNGTGTAVSVVPAVQIARVNILRGTITGFANGIDLANPGDNSSAISVQIQTMKIYGVSGFGIRLANNAIVGDSIIHTDGTGVITNGCYNSFIQNVMENPLGNSISKCQTKNIDNLGF